MSTLVSAHAPDETGFVFIHGAGLNGSVWRSVVEGFRHPYLVAEYPMRAGGLDARSRLTLDDYVQYMKKQIDDWGTRKVVMVAHSLGGVLAHRLASLMPHRLAGIIAVGAVIPKNGGSFLSAMPFPQKLILSLILRTAGTKPPEAAIRKGLCNDLPPDQADEIVNGFTPESVRVYTDRIHAAMPAVPKLYVKLTHDNELGPSLQNKMISNFAPQAVQSLETGHLPMISNPAGLRSILEHFSSEYLPPAGVRR